MAVTGVVARSQDGIASSHPFLIPSVGQKKQAFPRALFPKRVCRNEFGGRALRAFAMLPMESLKINVEYMRSLGIA